MKKIFLAILVLVSVGLAQMPPTISVTLFNNKTFASSALDTTGSISDGGSLLYIGAASRVGLRVAAVDTFSLTKIYMERRFLGNTAWTLVDSASTADITGTAPLGTNNYEWVFRSHALDKAAVIAGAIRFRLSFKSSGQSVLAAHKKYSLIVYLSK